MSDALLVGTRDGLYRVDGDGSHERCLEAPARVTRTATLGPVAIAGDRLHTAETGWEPVLEGPRRLTAVGEAGGRVLVGTAAPPLLLASDDGTDWTTVELPDRPAARRHLAGEGTVVTDADGPPVKHVSGLPDRPRAVAVGLEGDTLLVSRDEGRTWRERARGLGADVHRVLARGPRTWLAATGNGLYRTRGAGRRWTRLDTSQRYQQYTYYHGVAVHEGRPYAAGGAHMPGSWTGPAGAEGVILRFGPDGPVHEPYPGGPAAYPMALASVRGTLHAGTVAQDLDEPGTTPGRLLRRVDGTWETVTRLPAGIRSVAPAGGPGAQSSRSA